tara:strand:- start:411 stop:935 length:525 start_codon:yes stop_codon:yes gene_type:complete
MKSLRYYQFRYFLPLSFIQIITIFLPDFIIFMKFRGFMSSFFVKKCGKNFMLGRDITFYNPQNLYLGDNVYISKGTWINSYKKINIGNEVLIAPNVVIASAKHTYTNQSFRNGKPIGEQIEIMDGSWIGANSVITAGSRIGKGCFISPCSMISGKVNDNNMIGGNPAKYIKPLK